MLFNKKSDETATAPAAAPAPSKQAKPDPKNPGAETAMSVIAQGMRVVGDIECGGVLKIEGIVEGTIRGPRQLLLGRQGEVKGDIHAREIVLGGKVQGTVIADERIEIQGTAFVTGDVHTKSIVVLEGAWTTASRPPRRCCRRRASRRSRRAEARQRQAQEHRPRTNAAPDRFPRPATRTSVTTTSANPSTHAKLSRGVCVGGRGSCPRPLPQAASALVRGRPKARSCRATGAVV